MYKLYNLYQCRAFKRDEDESNLKKASSIRPKRGKITYDKILDNYCNELEKEEKSVLQELEKLNTLACINEKNTILEKNENDYDSDEDAEFFAKQYDVLLVDDDK